MSWCARMIGAGAVTLPLIAAAQAGPALRVTAPTAETVLRGRVSLTADVTPLDAGVRYVGFFVDGQQVCRVTTRPFACMWDAGDKTMGRNIRVVAELVSGTRLVQTLRTREPDTSMPMFGASTEIIMVPVQVTDERGRFIRGLTSRDFTILEDGEQQGTPEVLAESAPVSLVLALDMSASMEPLQSDLKDAASDFLGAVRRQDAVSVAAFNTTFFVLSGPTATPQARRAALDRLRPCCATALYDSLIRATDLVKTQPAPRAIAVFTDGEDVASRASLDTVRTALQAHDVGLYVVMQGDAPFRGSARADLAALSRETGGSARFATRMSTLRAQFAEILADLGNRYVLAYAPKRLLGDGRWRTIHVEVAGHSDYRIVSREGYIASRRDAGTR